MFTTRLQETFPKGITLPSRELEADHLRTLVSYPGERDLECTVTDRKPVGAKHPDRLQTEVRLHPEDYGCVSPSPYHLYSTTDEPDRGDEWEWYAIQENPDTDKMLSNPFFRDFPDFKGGPVVVNLADTNRLMDNLYIENIPMSKVTEILFQHPLLDTKELKETLQLFDLMQRGVEVIESGRTLMPEVAENVRTVTEALEHMYTGQGRPLTGHIYYQTEIRPIYNRELKSMAELMLRERKMIQTRPQSFVITWANGKGDGWECRKMTDVINDAFHHNARATQLNGPDSPTMQLDVFTIRPDLRKRILDTVTKSWAMRNMTEITDRAQLPHQISSWLDNNDAGKQLNLRFAGIKESLYAYEDGTDGYAIIDSQRKVTAYGEQLSASNMKTLQRIVSKENLMTTDGSLYFRPTGPKRSFLEKAKGRTFIAYEETVNGQKLLVEPLRRTPSRVQRNPEYFVEITGRITEAKVIGTGHGSAIKCKIDGEQQPATRILYDEYQAYRNGMITPEGLAVKHFTWELMQSPEEKQQQSQHQSTSPKR